ncbi:MAG: hypothetical protein JRI23_13200 [Deltaproteobacteria bacterium]|jgi:hypothetical protein|nr:hypothetical protein [Deltaproteobacteria bacterium]MBW2532680.1 hypothetical protein [Deltaproteobacteria bacterium]
MLTSPRLLLWLLLAALVVSSGCTMGVVGNPDGDEQSDALTETRAWQCEPVPEHCDGLDNDCNGQVDEGCPCENGETQSCYVNDPATEGVGVCAAGTQTCTNWQWGTCQNAITPSVEVCDGKDNNCDGNVDEGNPDGGNACVTSQPGVCAQGIYVCTAGNLECAPAQPPSSEVCDGLDNNCDGTVDEGNPGGGSSCPTGQNGICATGTMACQGGSLECVPDSQPTSEVCGDGLDNDCDGSTDEDCGTGGSGGGGGSCSHTECVTGAPLASSCSLCVTAVCTVDSFCCSVSWDAMCVAQAIGICGLSC